MALMTGEQYIESIRSLHLPVYMFGKKIAHPADDPILRPALNSVRMTYDLAQLPEYQDLMTAISPYTGERVNRFTHIHQSTEDLVKKVKMQRLLRRGHSDIILTFPEWKQSESKTSLVLKGPKTESSIRRSPLTMHRTFVCWKTVGFSNKSLSIPIFSKS